MEGSGFVLAVVVIDLRDEIRWAVAPEEGHFVPRVLDQVTVREAEAPEALVLAPERALDGERQVGETVLLLIGEVTLQAARRVNAAALLYVLAHAATRRLRCGLRLSVHPFLL